MLTYAERHFSAEQTLGGLLSTLGQDTGDLPPFIEAQLIFPYISGQRFVQRLYETGGAAGRSSTPPTASARPPRPSRSCTRTSTCGSSSPSGCALTRRARSGGWRRLAAGTWGEWATGELLRNSGPAEGWGGDRYELWRRGGGDCPAPCRDRDALVMRWRWDTRGDAREFETALREWLAARPGPSAVGSRGREVALALAPEADLADRLVE